MTAAATALACRDREVGGRLFTEVRLHSASGVNPLSRGTVSALRELLRTQGSTHERHGILLRADGRAFSAGADVKEFRTFGPDDFRGAMTGILALYLEMIRFPQPIVALVQGDALGGGAALAFCCDYVIAARGAKFGLPEVHRGLAGGGYLMPRLLGKHWAAEMVLLGRSLDADQAFARGLIGEVCEAHELAGRGDALLAELAALAPEGLAVAKKSLAAGLTIDLAPAMEAHIEAQTLAFRQGLERAGDGPRVNPGVRCLEKDDPREPPHPGLDPGSMQPRPDPGAPP